MPGFDPRPVHVALLDDKVPLGDDFLPVLRFSSSSITRLTLHIHSFNTDAKWDAPRRPGRKSGE